MKSTTSILINIGLLLLLGLLVRSTHGEPQDPEYRDILSIKPQKTLMEREAEKKIKACISEPLKDIGGLNKKLDECRDIWIDKGKISNNTEGELILGPYRDLGNNHLIIQKDKVAKVLTMSVSVTPSYTFAHQTLITRFSTDNQSCLYAYKTSLEGTLSYDINDKLRSQSKELGEKICGFMKKMVIEHMNKELLNMQKS